MISEAYGSRTTRSLKIITLRKLKNLESNLSIEKAIDFLNLIFGNSKEGEDFWNIILSGVSSMYKIHIKSYMDLSHGYLLTTVCDKCGFEIRLDSSYVLFSSHFPFNTRDWIQFNSEVSSFTFPSMHLY